MVENIDIGNNEDIIKEIKEKIKKNPKYINPCSKEFQEDIKRHKFENGNKFINWMQQNNILKNSIRNEIEYRNNLAKKNGFNDRMEHRDYLARKKGYDDRKEYDRERINRKNWNTGVHIPMSENEECSSYFGVYIGENYVSKTFEDPIMMQYGNKGFDWICKNGKKIQHQARCLRYDRNQWTYNIFYNNIADYFILSAWDNREDLEPLYVWIYHKDDMIRIGHGTKKDKFWKRDTFTITNEYKYLSEFEEYEVKDRLEKLKDLCKNINNI